MNFVLHLVMLLLIQETNKLLQDEYVQKFKEYASKIDNRVKLLTLEDIVNVINKLKLSEALYYNSLCINRLKYAHLHLINSIKTLINTFLSTGYVPDGFSESKITPIVKDKLGDIGKVTNYRPITIVCILSKVFEWYIMEYVEQVISKNYLQYGYVTSRCCEKACFRLRSIIDYFTLRGFNVFIAALGLLKAFDKGTHYGLLLKILLKMINARVPLFVMRVIGNYYSKLSELVY